MSGTIPTTRGLQRLTGESPLPRRRTVLAAFALVAGALVIAWIDARTWQKVGELERDFEKIREERFYDSIRLRLALRNLNDTLIRYHLKGEAEVLAQFKKDSADLQRSIAARRAEVSSPEERKLFEEIDAAYAAYLNETSALQKRHGFGFGRRQMDELNEKLHLHSAAFLDFSEQLMQAQSRSFKVFLGNSQNTLLSFQRLIKLSLVLLIVLAVSVVVLVYRGLITPLRAQLSESQAAIVRQEKLAALGGLAAGVAHEIRNPLTAIKIRLFSLKRSLPPSMAGNEDAAIIASEINRLERIVKDFLQFARPTEPELAQIPAARILDEIQALLKPQLDASAIELKLDLPDPVWLHADPQQIKQVLINLVQNAAESIGRNGVITLHAAPGLATLGGVDRPAAVITIADTGKGMTLEVQKRLFDPFFTTKEGGTGLGLPIAARIIEKHGGGIHYETQPHHGTQFKLILPLAPQE